MYGAEGLLDRMPGAKGPHPNRVASEVEEATLALERFDPEYREGHIEVKKTGELVAVDTSSRAR